jgi:hypothetical protein
MKKGYLLLLILVLLTFGYFIFRKDLGDNQKEYKKSENLKENSAPFIVKNRIDSFSIVKNGMVSLQNYKPIQFEVSGKLINGEVDFSSTLKFKKNQLLFRIDNRKQFIELVQKKKELVELIKTLKSEIESKFPKEIDKWNLYIEELAPSKLFIKNIEIHSSAEKSFFNEKGFFTAFEDLKKRELEMEKYFYLAPEDGEIQSLEKQEGINIKSNEIIAKYTYKKPQFVVKTIVSNSDIGFIKLNLKITYLDENSFKIGIGEVVKINGNEIVTTADLSKSFLVDGTIITVDYGRFSKQPFASVPKRFIERNSVTILENGKTAKKKVNILKSEGGKCLVVGLKDGEQLITKN